MLAYSFSSILEIKVSLEESANEENSLSDVPLSPRSFDPRLQQW